MKVELEVVEEENKGINVGFVKVVKLVGCVDMVIFLW